MARKLTHAEEVELAKLRLRAAARPSAGALAHLDTGAPVRLFGQLLGTRAGRLAGSALLGLVATLVVRSPRLRMAVLSAVVRSQLPR